MWDNAVMERGTPLHTFWSIIGMTTAALVVTHLFSVPGEKAMPIFLAFMILGIPLGELLERRARRSRPQ
jgi:hypothetical protein